MEKPNIIWFMVDSMRNEFLNEFGADVERNFLDELISEGVSFTNCNTAAPFTIVSMGAKLTGCLPSMNGLDGWMKENPMKALDPRCLTIIDILKYQGYYNTLYSDSPYGVYLPGECFDVYHTQEGYDNFPVENYINHQGPKFIYLCTDIIHDSCCQNQGHFTVKDYQAAVKITADTLKGYYDRIKSENDLILITSDHGIRCVDDFKGKKYSAELTTGRYLTEKTTRSSFSIVWKGHLRPLKVDQMCRTIDILPTLFDVLGFEYPKLDGISLKPTLDGKKVDIKYSYTVTGWSITHPQNVGAWCVKDERYKLVEFEELRGFSTRIITALYDYQADKEEENDLSQDMPEKVLELQRECDRMIHKKRTAQSYYDAYGFQPDKYIAVRDETCKAAQHVNDIINGIWKRHTRKNFLWAHYKSEIKRLFYYYILGKMLFKY